MKLFTDESKLNEVMDIIDKAAELMDSGTALTDKTIADLKERLDGLTGNDNDMELFREYWGHSSLKEMAEAVLVTDTQQGSSMSDDEIREIVRRICANEFSDSQLPSVFDAVGAAVGRDNISDYIYWPTDVGLANDATPQQIAEKIIADRI
ncbi:MAG: hypothetical protein IJ368_02430 [Oscillospiraceae bacterium]|nr:hypothetical protein [Oscillospiraceae bacterium]